MDIRIEWRPDPASPASDRTRAREGTDTRWSLVLAAGTRDGGAAPQALCRCYWGAAYAYIRRCGLPPAVAHDVSAAFFAHFAGEGLRGLRPRAGVRFRDVLLARLSEAHADRWREVRRTRVDGSLAPPWPAEMAEDRYLAEVGDHDPPETAFERGWSQALVTRCFARLRAEADACGRLAMYERLLPYLGGDPCADDARAAVASGLTPAAAAFALRSLRTRLREILAEETAEPLPGVGGASAP
jgi:hypothetical protein